MNSDRKRQTRAVRSLALTAVHELRRIVMVPVIYTTYGVAMGHRAEILAASGGLKPGKVRVMRERTTRLGCAHVSQLLNAVLIRVGMWHGSKNRRATDIQGTVTPALSRNR